MGNWRTINITGTCPPDQVDALRAACELEYPDCTFEELTAMEPEDFPLDPHCLSWTKKGSLFGVQDWVGVRISSGGNVGKDVHEEEVAETLEGLAKVAPGLRVVVHMGGDWESEECVSTLVLEDGKVEVGPALVPTVSGVSGDVAGERMRQMLLEGSDGELDTADEALVAAMTDPGA